MANPFYNNQQSQFYQTNSNSFGNIKDLYKILSNSNNPIQLFRNMAKNNPNMTPIVNLLDKGYSPEQIFNEVCKQRGVNPQEFIKSLRN